MSRRTTLGAIAEITSSKRIYASEYIDEGVPFWRGKEVVEAFSKGDTKSELFISPERFAGIESRFGAPKAGDLLITSVGTLGIPYIVPEGQRFYFKDGNLIWFRNPTGVNSRYLFYWLQSRSGKAELAKCTIGTSQQAFTIEKLKTAEISLPEIEVQEKVANVIATYDSSIRNNRRRIKLLEEAARLIYREWFVHLRFPEYKNIKIINGVPDGWSRETVSAMCSRIDYGYTASADSEPVGPRFLRITDIVPSMIDWDTVPFCRIDERSLSKNKLARGDIVVARTGATVGFAKRIGERAPESVFASYLVRFRPLNKNLSALLGVFMESTEFKSFVFSQINGAAQPNANAKVLGSATLLIPSNDVLEKFSAVIEPVYIQRELLQLSTNKLRQARDLLLPRLMSGEIEI